MAFCLQKSVNQRVANECISPFSFVVLYLLFFSNSLSVVKMAPQTRGMSFPKVLIERDSDSEESSSEEEEDEENDDDEVQKHAGEEESDEEQVEEKDEASTSTKSRREPITISLKKVCKVNLATMFLLFFTITFCWIFGFKVFGLYIVSICAIYMRNPVLCCYLGVQETGS